MSTFKTFVKNDLIPRLRDMIDAAKAATGPKGTLDDYFRKF